MPAKLKILPPPAVTRARELYRERNPATGRGWTIWELAEEFLVSETTMYRALRGIGPYRAIAAQEEEISSKAADALARMLALTGELRSAGASAASAADEMVADLAATPPTQQEEEKGGREMRKEHK